jgi:hypothetical protein
MSMMVFLSLICLTPAMSQEICEKSIPVLPDALARSGDLFIRNERVPKYVPQVLSKYGAGAGEIPAGLGAVGMMVPGLILQARV